MLVPHSSLRCRIVPSCTLSCTSLWISLFQLAPSCGSLADSCRSGELNSVSKSMIVQYGHSTCCALQLQRPARRMFPVAECTLTEYTTRTSPTWPVVHVLGRVLTITFYTPRRVSCPSALCCHWSFVLCTSVAPLRCTFAFRATLSITFCSLSSSLRCRIVVFCTPRYVVAHTPHLCRKLCRLYSATPPPLDLRLHFHIPRCAVDHTLNLWCQGLHSDAMSDLHLRYVSVYVATTVHAHSKSRTRPL